MGLLGRFNYWGAAFSIMGILASSDTPMSIASWAKLLSQVALAVKPDLATDKNFQMVQQSLANLDAATAAQGAQEIGKPVGFLNGGGKQMYLHFMVDKK
jgi:hypothetical protein